ncbi:hypothetical protein SGCZBJ_02405 [Caulobacter zeae]|uniref:Uncharacterized protein n=1 Tax=Caulobacter zeae TaxID=2055137 RepID=A0A2N5DRB9_9CAUL|nr:hypothetical protein SGCZBJ_02405 [Caulobacter zeae]
MARRAGGGRFQLPPVLADDAATPLSVAFGDTSPRGRGAFTHIAEIPPSSFSSAPVMNLLSSLAR